MEEEDRKHVAALLENARASLARAKKDASDARRAGLTALADKLDKDIRDVEIRISSMESVYKR